ncbi:MAG: hypothetical protein ABR514_11930 [Chthoniobacterales bacterium]
MNGSRFSLPIKAAARVCLALIAITTLLSQPIFTAAALDQESDRAPIDCVTPDGRLNEVSNAATPAAHTPALLAGENTLSCELQEGDTVFIIPVPKTAALDRFTFVNLNAAASGEFSIAIAASRLKPNNPGWVQVDGIVPFSHKRLFNLSFLGTGAKYVKLSFHVEKTNRLTMLHHNSTDAQRARVTAEPPPPAAGPADN